MKKKMLISLVACFIAAGSFVHYNFAQNHHNTDISLADISVMAQADGESGGPCNGHRYWDYWFSTVDGYDCECNARQRVWGEC